MKIMLISVCAAALLVSAVACHKDPARPAEGPMERAGRKVDDAAEKTRDGTMEAADKAKDDAKDAKDTIKRKAK